MPSRVAENGPRQAAALPSALTEFDRIAPKGRPLVLFLDYDGTLTPIVQRPELAHLPETTRAILGRLSARATVVVISGRDREDIQSRVGLQNILYAGSHGYEIGGPQDAVHLRIGAEHTAQTQAAAAAAEASVAGVPGVRIERKKFSFAVHFREASEDAARRVEEILRRLLSSYPRLRLMRGKRVFEVHPDLEWDKGKAVRYILTSLPPKRRSVVFVGDDRTDEDAFMELESEATTVLVRDTDRQTWARFALDSPKEVERLLGLLLEASTKDATEHKPHNR
jgi:trehalose 6-phosphate phosphatase